MVRRRCGSKRQQGWFSARSGTRRIQGFQLCKSTKERPQREPNMPKAHRQDHPTEDQRLGSLATDRPGPQGQLRMSINANHVPV